MDRWQGINNVVVVGLGITGLSVVKHLHGLPKSLAIRVIDTRQQPPGLDELPSQVEVHTGSWHLTWLQQADLIVVNPGIALANQPLQQALQQNIPVIGDIELFAWAVTKPVVAITGSNGKSTITDLTGVLLKAAGLQVGVGGNIGVPALQLLSEPVDAYVLELSSFQLETTSNLALQAAAFVNLSEDHMDRYQGMNDYRQAKLRIFDQAKLAIVNRDDAATLPDDPKLPVVSFGFDAQQYGIVTLIDGDYLAFNGNPILAVAELSLVGRHNQTNALVALALLASLGVDSQHPCFDSVLMALSQYRGLSHRCQLVAEQHGVKWVNDSKATNVASTLAALSGLQLQGQLHLLVGGVGKGADFSELAPVLAELDVALYCFGQDGDQFMSLHPSAQQFTTMEQIIEHISPCLQSGDVVMLSPACASFDQFNNFMHRGEVFSQLAVQYSNVVKK